LHAANRLHQRDPTVQRLGVNVGARVEERREAVGHRGGQNQVGSSVRLAQVGIDARRQHSACQVRLDLLAGVMHRLAARVTRGLAGAQQGSDDLGEPAGVEREIHETLATQAGRIDVRCPRQRVDPGEVALWRVVVEVARDDRSGQIAFRLRAEIAFTGRHVRPNERPEEALLGHLLDPGDIRHQQQHENENSDKPARYRDANRHQAPDDHEPEQRQPANKQRVDLRHRVAGQFVDHQHQRRNGKARGDSQNQPKREPAAFHGW
jgi:hypothetical protein